MKLNLQNKARIIHVYWGGEAVMESGYVELGNLFKDNPTHKDRRNYYKELSAQYPFEITGNKITSLEERNAFVEQGSYSLIGDLPNERNNLHKALAMLKFSGNHFTGNLTHLVNARFGMLPRKKSIFEKYPDYPYNIELGTSFATFNQPFDYSITYDENEQPEVSSIQLYGETLRSMFQNTSFVFITQDYKLFLGKITQTQIFMRECKVSSIGSKISETLKSNKLPSGATKKDWLAFLYTQIEGLGESELIFDFTSSNLYSSFGSPTGYGWHASFQVNSLGQQQLAIVLRKRSGTSASARYINCLVTIDISYFAGQWDCSISTTLGGQYLEPTTNYIWSQSYPNKMTKNPNNILASGSGTGYFYVFYTEQDNQPVIFEYQNGGSVSDVNDIDTLCTVSGSVCRTCGLSGGIIDNMRINTSINSWKVNKGNFKPNGNSSYSGSKTTVTFSPSGTSEGTYNTNSLSENNICDGTPLTTVLFQSCNSAWNTTNPHNMSTYVTYQNYSGDREIIYFNRSTSGKTHFIFQGSDSVLLAHYQSVHNKDNVVTYNTPNGSTPIGWWMWSRACEEQEDGSILVTDSKTTLNAIKRPVSLPSANYQSNRKDETFTFMDLYVYNPLIQKKVLDQQDIEGIWLTMYSAELLDFEISPVTDTPHGNNSSFNIHIDNNKALVGQYSSINVASRIIGAA
jgi:hypothetical protein